MFELRFGIDEGDALADLTKNRWVEALSDEDLAFIKRFLLASGSLKETAGLYGVSYPTVRLRLDRLIQKIRLADTQPEPGPFERVLRARFADGRIDVETFNALRDAYNAEKIAKENPNETPDNAG